MPYRLCLVFSLLCLLLPVPAGAVDFDAVLADYEAYAVKGMKDWQVPGMAVAVVRGERIVCAKGFGTRRYGAALPVDKDTVFQVGSTTKAFTVALMASLVDEGKVGWDDRVIDHFPDFRMYDPWVTREFRIHDLFAQHSGLPPYAGDLQAFLGFGRDRIVRSLRYIKPVYSFRDRFSYVNNLFVAGAKVEEIMTGKTWEQLMRERILVPLGMTRSSLDQAGLTGTENHSALHLLADGKPMVIEPGSPLMAWPYIYGPAGGLNSTAMDMARWASAQLHDGQGAARIFSKDASAAMHAPRTPILPGRLPDAYCMGWLATPLAKTDVTWHNGGTSGICSFVGFSADLDMAVVVLTNLGGHKLADALGLQFFEMMSGNEQADWNQKFLNKSEDEDEEPDTAPALPGLPLKDYAGEYASPIYGTISVTAQAKGLVLRLGPDHRFRLPVTHKTMHTFTGEWTVLDPGDPVYHFDFGVEPGGAVNSLTIREFNSDGTCTFEKTAPQQ
jgi:CubicO group peptidase (beta-lactamase class C family)